MTQIMPFKFWMLVSKKPWLHISTGLMPIIKANKFSSSTQRAQSPWKNIPIGSWEVMEALSPNGLRKVMRISSSSMSSLRNLKMNKNNKSNEKQEPER